MLQEPIVATVILFALIALGECISIYTRARIPMLMTAMLGFLVLTWIGVFPENILELSTLPALGAILIGPLIVHMGTLMRFRILKKQWRAVVIALSGLAGALALILSLVTLIYDFPTAASGIGPVSGGVVALLITNEKLTELGLTSLIVVPVLVQSFQGVIGMPLAAAFMKKYGRRFMAEGKEAGSIPFDDETDVAPVRFSLMKNNTIKLFAIFVLAAAGVMLGSVTGIHYTLFCLLFGILALNTNLLPKSALESANSFSFMMVALIFVIIGTMGGITPQDVLDNILAVILILGLGIFGIMAGGLIASKLVGWHPYKGMPVALTALIGFPGDYLICEEVARSETDNAEDEAKLFQELVTPMLIGGFVTVTVASVFIATFVMSLI
ncbi:hypothetical protein [Salinicoccus halodurans]|uniref:Uncharacterized protein n=1 Tax=Salinicoccus halodurans TaxID=407035 RepID=A0A0F7HMD7_9STAP|nr:hypothetical protein [Salinicoccus halodurans]AKG74678.1 hypothetical protein AAT16_11030 [Salinicoccus halodurans]SFK88574.1 hypothetical protein SAMN05216235_2245 [Salinicoccus halodurans]